MSNDTDTDTDNERTRYTCDGCGAEVTILHTNTDRGAPGGLLVNPEDPDDASYTPTHCATCRVGQNRERGAQDE